MPYPICKMQLFNRVFQIALSVLIELRHLLQLNLASLNLPNFPLVFLSQSVHFDLHILYFLVLRV